MKRYIYLVLILVISFSFISCNTKLSTPVIQPTNKADNKSLATVNYYNVARDFLNQKNLKIIVNSESTKNILLPSNFKALKNNIAVGNLLRQWNEKSKQNSLDFSKYMGHKVIMYTAKIYTGKTNSNYYIVLFIAQNKVIGYWVDGGIKDLKQNRPDFNVLVNLL